MSNSAMATSSSSVRKFLTQEQVFHGFNDYQDGVWGADYESKNQYWQISYEWADKLLLGVLKEILKSLGIK